MIDIMINEANYESWAEKLGSNKHFSTRCLLQLPLSTLHKKHREKILRSWLSRPEESADNDSEGLLRGSTDAAVLSLLIKFMQRPTFYEVCNSFDALLELGINQY